MMRLATAVDSESRRGDRGCRARLAGWPELRPAACVERGRNRPRGQAGFGLDFLDELGSRQLL